MIQHFYFRIMASALLLMTFNVVAKGQESWSWAEPMFRHTEPLIMAITSKAVIEEYVPPLKDPNVEHYFPIPPTQFVRNWVRDRIRVMGGLHKLRLRIIDASVVRQPLEVTKGWRAIFVNDQSDKYTAKFTIRLEIQDNQSSNVVSWIEAKSTYSKTVPESASINERDQAYLELTEAAMAALDLELEQQIMSHFSPYLIQQ